MKSQITQQNRERLLTLLKSRRSDKLADESLTKMEGALTPSEAKLFDVWKTLSFTAHHATQHWSEIKKDGALRSVRARLLSGSLNASHTAGVARQGKVYFSVSIGGHYLAPRFTGENPTVITLPLRCINSDLVKEFSISNHEQWFAGNEQTDPIEINSVVRHIKFDNDSKTYHYHNNITGESWERSVKALEETFYAENRCESLLEILGLQFILELYEFGGELRQKILGNPLGHRKLIVKLFHQWFPSEIYPELHVSSNVPENLQGIHVTTPNPKTQQDIKRLHDAIIAQDEKEVDQLLAAGVSLEGASVCDFNCCRWSAKTKHINTPVITAFRAGCYDIGFKLIERGANIQTTNLNYPEHLLQIVIEQLDCAISLQRSEKIEELLKVLSQLIDGIEIPELPGLKQHFSLSHADDDGVLNIIALLNLRQRLDEQDYPKIQKLKNSILSKVTSLIPVYRPLNLLKLLYCSWGMTSGSAFDSQKLSALNELLEQKCEVDDGFSVEATRRHHLEGLKWALRNNGKILPPSHALSPFRDIIQEPAFSLSIKIKILEFLLEQYPLSSFTPQDFNCAARLLQSPKTKKLYAIQPKQLETMERIFTTTPEGKEIKEAKAAFSEVRSYPKLDHAVGAVIFVTVGKKTFTLLIIRSEQFSDQLVSYCGPGGLIELGEDPDSAVRREISEETRLETDSKNIQTSVICEEKASGCHLKHLLYVIDLGERSALPVIGPRSDALTAEWVDIRELNKKGPILRSNSEVIEARLKGQPIDADRVEQLLFLESRLGQQQFEALILTRQMKQAEKMIEEGVNVNAGRAMLLAMFEPESKSLLKKMIAAGGDINKMYDKKTLIHYLYEEIESYSLKDKQTEERQKQEKLEWLLRLITDFNIDWIKCTHPTSSLMDSLIKHKRDHLLISLIEKRNPMSDIFYSHCFKKSIENGRIELLNALLKNYPQFAAQKISDEKWVILAAEKSFLAFQWMLENGAKLPQKLLEIFYRLHEEQQLKLNHIPSDALCRDYRVSEIESNIDYCKKIIKISERFAQKDLDRISISAWPQLSIIVRSAPFSKNGASTLLNSRL